MLASQEHINSSHKSGGFPSASSGEYAYVAYLYYISVKTESFRDVTTFGCSKEPVNDYTGFHRSLAQSNLVSTILRQMF